jgi:hypothetical protein
MLTTMPLASPHLPVCPECGGLIGATTTTSRGYPCTCVSPSADTVDEPTFNSGVVASATTSPKRCHKCGKDLTGHRRFKDSLGYWCKDCHRVDKARNTIPESRCPDCGRMRPLDKLVTTDDGTQVCLSCLKERKAEATKLSHRAEAAYVHQRHERRNLYILAGVFVALILIVAVHKILRSTATPVMSSPPPHPATLPATPAVPAATTSTAKPLAPPKSH